MRYQQFIPLLLLFVCFFSCSKLKESMPSEPLNQDFFSGNDFLRASSLEKLRLSIAEKPSLRKITVPVNDTVFGYFADNDFNRITGDSHQKRLYNCADPFDMNFPPASTLISYSYEYHCDSGFKFTFSWQVSMSVNLLVSNPGGAMSKGRVRVIGSGIPVYTDLNLTPLAIMNLGYDHTTLNENFLFSVKYETGWIHRGYLGDVYSPTVQTSFAAYTDCVEMPTYVTGYKTIDFPGSNTRTRIDPLSVGNLYPGSGDTTAYGLIMGFGNIVSVGGCPFSGDYPDRYELELKCVVPGKESNWKNTSPRQGVWPGNRLTDGHLGMSFDSATQKGTIGLYDIYYVPLRDLHTDPSDPNKRVHGEYLVRHRNVMYDGCKGDWSEEIPVIF